MDGYVLKWQNLAFKKAEYGFKWLIISQTFMELKSTVNLCMMCKGHGQNCVAFEQA